MENNNTDNTNNTKLKSDEILENSKKVLEEVKNSNEKLANEIKDNSNVLVNGIKDIVNSIKEEKKREEEVKEMVVEDKNETLFIKNNGEALQKEIKEYNREINTLLKKGSIQNKNFFEDEKFVNLLKARLEEECPSESKATIEKSIEDLKDEFTKGLVSGQDIPYFEVKNNDGTFRENVGEDGGFATRPITMNPYIINNYSIKKPFLRELMGSVKILSKEYGAILSAEPDPAYCTGEEAPEVPNSSSKFKTEFIKVGTIMRNTRVTRDMKEDAAINLLAKIREDDNEEFRKKEELLFLNGSGENNNAVGLFNSYFGEINIDTAFNVNKNSYNFEVDKFLTKTLNKTDTTPVATLIDSIKEAVDVLRDIGVDNLSILMNTLDYIKVSQAKDGVSRYLFDTYGANTLNPNYRLFGCPVYTSRAIPSMLASASAFNADTKGLFIGDLRKTYTIVDRLSIVRWVNEITESHYITYMSRKRVGGRPTNFSKGLFIKVGA